MNPIYLFYERTQKEKRRERRKEKGERKKNEK